MNEFIHLNDLPRAYPWLDIKADIRTLASDFSVDEELGFLPDGEGEHSFLHIRKTGRNTEDVARALARHANVSRKNVSYAGLKDRNAVTTQTFSVHLPGKDDPDWMAMGDSSLEILSSSRHRKKLKRGALQRNHFCLLLRRFRGDREQANQRLEEILAGGVPNYFSEQRFGYKSNNLIYADEMLLKGRRVKDRFKRSMYFSAARSWLFNLVLAERIRLSNWSRVVAGDSMMLSGSRSCFSVESIDDELKRRVDELDISPTGPLWGRGESMITNEAAEIEATALDHWQQWREALERSGQKMARRSLRTPVNGLSWSWPEEDQLKLKFSLQPGCYATAVLRELGSISVPEQKQLID